MMLTHLYRTALHAVRDVSVDKKRSPHWPAVEHKWLKDHSTCAACGGNVNLNVHHIMPFHIDPSLELADGSDGKPANLITLCMAKERHCHLLLGHGDSFKAFNQEITKDANDHFQAIQSNQTQVCEAIVTRAKMNRKLA